jgi:hypothetical protein
MPALGRGGAETAVATSDPGLILLTGAAVVLAAIVAARVTQGIGLPGLLPPAGTGERDSNPQPLHSKWITAELRLARLPAVPGRPQREHRRDAGRSRTGQRQFCGLPPAPARSVPCALPGGLEPPISSSGNWRPIRWTMEAGGRGEIRTPTTEAAALRAACLTHEQPALGVNARNRAGAARVTTSHADLYTTLTVASEGIEPPSRGCEPRALPLS